MRSHHLSAFVVIGATALGTGGCAGAGFEADVAYPAQVEVEPGVWVVDNAAYPTYFVDNWYWYHSGGVWFRRPRWGGSWVRVGSGVVPPRIARRDEHPYRWYTARGNHPVRMGHYARAPHRRGR